MQLAELYCYCKDDQTMHLRKLLPVSILTTQSDNTHMVCCWKVHLSSSTNCCSAKREK